MLGLTLDILRAAGVNVSGGGGGPTPPPYTPPLDDYSGAAAAYSVRLLSTSYGAGGGAALRVRRDVPPYDEQDIGFYSDGQLDNQAIIDFGGSDILKVSRWYDQSGQSNHAVQPTYGNQPQIYNGTEVITENGRPSLSFSTSSEMEVSGMTYSNPSARLDTYAVVLFNSLPSASTIYNGSVGFFDNQIRSVANQNNLRAMNSSVRTGPSISTNTQYSAYWRLGGTYTDDASLNLSSAINGGTLTGLTSGNVNPTVLQINQDNLISMQLQEMLVYNPPSDTNRSGIETNINDYYNVSTEYNPDAATSGFLFDYPNAAAAYSVRQLNNNATYCMQVERSDGHTMNIGFVAGDLDTQAIIDFAGASYAKVSRWFDQSGNQSHLESYNPDHQPEIYDGTSIVIDGSYPTINFQRIGGTPKTMTGYINVASLPQPVTYSYVSNLIDASGYGRMGGLGNQAVYTLGLLNAGSFLSVQNFAGYEISSVIFDTTSLRRVNGVQTNSGNAGTDAGTNNIVFSSSSPARAWVNGRTQEFIIWGSNKSTAGNISGIEIDQNSYYSVY